MKMKKSCVGSGLLLAASFFVPLVIILALYAINGIAPFGDNTLLIADAFGQYDSFWIYYRELLAGERDVFYSFSKTLGGSMSGLFAYYLASPFNLMFALFPAGQLPAALHLITLLKLSLCGLTFALFWDKTRTISWKTLLLSTAYALCAYSICFSWCIMWLDGVILLPIIALGLHRLADGGRPWVYIFALGGAIICSYYIGFMLCIFSIFYYVYLIALKNKEWKDIDWRNAGTFAASSAVAGALSAVVLLPGILAMSGGKRAPMDEVLMEYISRYAYPLFDRICPERAAEYESMAKTLLIVGAVAVAVLLALLVFIFAAKRVPKKLKLAAGIVCGAGFIGYNIIRENYVLLKLLTATTTKNEMMSGTPNIFTGILIALLALVYFVCRNTIRREKLISLIFAAVMLFSFSSLSINMIWHGFTENHSFNYRYSFIFTFFMLILAGQALDKLSEISLRDLVISGGAVALLAAAGILLRAEFINTGIAVSDIILAGVMCAALYFMSGASGRRMGYIAAALLVVLHMGNLVFSAGSTLDSMLSSYHHSADEYAGSTAVTEQTGELLADDVEFWRARKDYLIKGQNDAIQGGYNGVGSYSSAEKTAVVDFMAKLGALTYENIWANGEYGLTRAADSLLGVRWLLSSGGGYTDYIPVSGTDLYENPYALPVGFVTDSSILSAVSESDCPFEYTNRVFDALTSVSDADIFTPAQISSVTMDNLYCILSGSDCDSVYGVKDAAMAGMLTYTVDITSDDVLYLYMTAEEYQDTDIYINGQYYCEYFDYYAWNAVLLGSFTPGEQITVSVSANTGMLSVGNAYLYYEDEAVLQRYRDLLTVQPCVTGSQTDSRLTTRLTAAQEGWVMYTIPADAGWSVTVDGEPVQTKEALGLFIAVPVSEGEHTVELTFLPQGLIAGAVITAAAVIAVAAWIVIDRRRGIFTACIQ